MKIEIKNRFTGEIICSGEFASLKECVEKNSAYLSGADLRGADLRGADLRGAYLSDAYLWGAYLSDADLSDADLSGADLSGAYLSDADLSGADLRGADLRGADLCGAKNYLNSHEIFAEIIRRQEIKTFTDKEWSIIGQITIHRLCWDSIQKRYGKKVMPIFKKLSGAGFNGWENYYKEVTK